jgi:hypothetical protein
MSHPFNGIERTGYCSCELVKEYIPNTFKRPSACVRRVRRDSKTMLAEVSIALFIVAMLVLAGLMM